LLSFIKSKRLNSQLNLPKFLLSPGSEEKLTSKGGNNWYAGNPLDFIFRI